MSARNRPPSKKAKSPFRVVAAGLLRSREERSFQLNPPLKNDEQPYAVHKPAGAIGIVEGSADHVVLKNGSDRPVAYVLVVGSQGIMKFAFAANSLLEGVKALATFIKR